MTAPKSAHDDVWGDPIAGEGNTRTDPYLRGEQTT